MTMRIEDLQKEIAWTKTKIESLEAELKNLIPKSCPLEEEKPVRFGWLSDSQFAHAFKGFRYQGTVQIQSKFGKTELTITIPCDLREYALCIARALTEQKVD